MSEALEKTLRKMEAAAEKVLHEILDEIEQDNK